MDSRNNMARSSASRRHGRAKGLTLMELVVVLVVLAALAGIVVPLLPNVIDRSHASTTATSIAEVNKAIQLYEATTLRAPDGWDSLISDADGTHETFRDDRFTIVELDDGTPLAGRISSALSAIGITRSYEFDDGIQGNGRPEGHANRPASGARVNTFDPYSGVEFDLTDDGKVVILGPGANEFNRLNLTDPADEPNTEAYVVFGIGARLTALDRTLAEAPVHFPSQGDLDPTQAYGRMVAVYAIPSAGPARLVRTAAVHNDHLDALGGLIAEFYDTTN